MKKLVIKTTVIALTIIIALTFFIGAMISIASPLTVANACFRLGNKDLAVKYTEKHYLKTLEFNDLALLVERGISANHDKIVNKYANEFLYSEDFEIIQKPNRGITPTI